MAADATPSFAGTSTTAAGSASGAVDQSALSPVVWFYLLTVIIPVEFKLGTLSLSPLRVLLLVLVVTLTIRLFSGNYGKVLAVDYLFFIHMFWATVAVAVNNPTRVLENVGSAAVEFLGGYLIARAYIRTPAQLETVIKIMVVLIAMSLPFALVEARTGNAVIPNFISKIPGLSSVKQVIAPKRMGLFRVQYVFAHPIHYGLFCSVAFALMFLGLRDRVSLGKRTVSAAIIVLGVFLSLSSGPLLAVMLQVGLATWSFIFRSVQRKWLFLIGLFCLGYAVVDVISNRGPLKVLMSYATFSAQTAYYRSIIFDWGMRNVWANPVFGLGLRTWVRPAYMITGTVDNFWLVMAMRYGIPGFILVAAGYLSGLAKVGTANLSFSERASRLRFAWMITFCGLSFTLTTVHVWSTMYSFVFFFFGTGMWMIGHADEASRPEAENIPQPVREARSLNYRRAPAVPTPSLRGEGPQYARSGTATQRAPKTDEPEDAPGMPYTRFPPRPPGKKGRA